MANSVQMLVKINDLGIGNIDTLKKYMYDSLALIHMHEVDELRLDAISLNIDLNDVLDYSSIYQSDITIIYYDTGMGYAKKIEAKYGIVASNKAMTFGMDAECEIFEASKDKEDGFFELLKTTIDKVGGEDEKVISVGDLIEIDTFLCRDTDLLDWYCERDEKHLKVNHIEYQSSMLYVDDCEYAIFIEEVNKVS